MSIKYNEAYAKLMEWTDNPALVNHGKMVGTVMKVAAHKYGAGKEDEERWEIAGLLHDADYCKWPEEHPKRIMAWLNEKDEPEIAHAISAHYTPWGAEYNSEIDKALLACDELTGFIAACCHIRPGGIANLTPKSVKKRLKSKSFAAKVERPEVAAGIEKLGVDETEHIQFIIDTLKPYAKEFGLLGQ